MTKSTRLEKVDAASTMADFRPIASDALSMFSEQAITLELQALQKSLKLPKPGNTPDLSEEEWREIMEDFLRCLGATELDQMTGYPRLLDDDEAQEALAGRIQAALRAVEFASRSVDSEGGPTGLLLPTSYARRIETLLGMGVLPVAWVRQLDVCRF